VGSYRRETVKVWNQKFHGTKTPPILHLSPHGM